MSSPGQRPGSCGHAMAGFDSHSKCARCRDKGRKNVLSVEGLPLNRTCNCLPLLTEIGTTRRRLRPPPLPLSWTLHMLVCWVKWRSSRLYNLPLLLLRRRSILNLPSLLPIRRNLPAVDHLLKIYSNLMTSGQKDSPVLRQCYWPRHSQYRLNRL